MAEFSLFLSLSLSPFSLSLSHTHTNTCVAEAFGLAICLAAGVKPKACARHLRAASIRQHMSAYVSIRQHKNHALVPSTSASSPCHSVSICTFLPVKQVDFKKKTDLRAVLAIAMWDKHRVLPRFRRCAPRSQYVYFCTSNASICVQIK